MKYLYLLFFTILFSCVHSQKANLLLEKDLITDWSKFSIYPRMVESKNGKDVWKEDYHYMESIEVYRMTYLSDGLKINGIMVKPKKKGKYPCIIYNRGGNREMGSLKPYHGALILGQIANEGYVVVASQYRGNGGSEGQEEFGGDDVNDVLALIDVLSEIENANTEKIGMYGWSRGGMMTYIALTKTDRIKAAAVGGAVADSYAMINDRPVMETNVLSELIPHYEINKEIELNKRSAVMWVNKFPKNVPILLLHGNSDWRVKPEQSLRLALEFDKYRIPYRLVMFEGGDHGITEHRNEVTDQVKSWFDRYLKNDEPTPNMEYHGR